MSRKKKSELKAATLWAQDGRIFIRTDYDPDFVTKFKEMVPAKHRSWKPKPDRIWTCEPAYLDELHTLCSRLFDTVSILEPENESGIPADSVGVDGANGEDSYRMLLKHCPDAYLKKIYRAVIRANHPDKGGTAQAAADVNLAWKAIRTERGI